MSQPATSPAEPTIQFRWSDTGPYAQPDIFPLRFFEKEGGFPAEIHKVGSKPGTKSEAKCDVRVKGVVAELDYQPYPDFNRANNMLLGVTRLTFADSARTKLLSAEWKPQGKLEFEAPVASSRPNVLSAPKIGSGRNYYRVMLGKKSVHAAACFEGGFIGTDFGVKEDLASKLSDDWREFNRYYIPIYQATHPDKSKIAAGLACGFLWTVSKGIQVGDVVLSPNGSGRYRVGEVTGQYYYVPDAILFHRRPVHWTDTYVDRDTMSEGLRNSAGSIGTVSNLSRAGHHEELEKLVGQVAVPTIVSTDVTVEDPSVFALEKHLEDFLVQNWKQTELGKKYELFEDENGTGRQYPSDTGPIDILAISKDKKELLVVELKKGRASDSVVGQIQRYMGYVQEELAEDDQKVRGVIIALEDDLRIRRALKVAVNIEFYRYEVSFKLFKA